MRTKGWQMPAGAVYVGRPTKWGNPYVVGVDGDAEQCVILYARLVLVENIWTEPNVRQIQAELRGRDLLCWCPPSRLCHGDILLLIANSNKFGDDITEWVCKRLKIPAELVF